MSVRQTEIALLERNFDGAVTFYVADFGRQPWARRKARKPSTCVATGMPILPGDLVYAPIGNPLNRSMRVLASWVDAR